MAIEIIKKSLLRNKDLTAENMIDYKPESYGFTFIDNILKQIDNVDDKNCIAKVVKIDDNNSMNKIRTRYYLIINLWLELYNPWQHDSKPDLHNQFDNIGRKIWKFKEVTEANFKRYLRFLETRNESHLLITQRETIND